MKGRAIPYSAVELAWLEANHLLPLPEFHAGFAAAFDRPDVAPGHLHALRKRKGWKTGRTGQFEPGQPPMNKGRKCGPGEGGNHPNARATQFRKGQMSGTAQANYKPVGFERVTEDGYRERKISNTGPSQRRWRAVHLLEWEAINGPLPAGHALKCLDGNRLNTDPSNWQLVTRSVLARLNGGRHRKTLPFDQAPPELKPLVMASAQLKDAAANARRAVKPGLTTEPVSKPEELPR